MKTMVGVFCGGFKCSVHPFVMNILFLVLVFCMRNNTFRRACLFVYGEASLEMVTQVFVHMTGFTKKKKKIN